MGHSSKKCFVISEARAQLLELREALRKRQIAELDASASTGESLWASIAEMVSQADFCVAVLSGAAASPAVMLELGFAMGARKPVLILAQGTSPSIRYSLPIAPSRIVDYRNLEAYLDGFIQNLSEKPRATQRSQRKRHRGSGLKLPPFGATKSPSQVLEDIVAAAVGSEGVPTWTGGRDTGIDAAVWAQTLGGPLLIQTKAGPNAREWLTREQLRLQKEVLNRAAAGGLLVYWSPDEAQPPEVAKGPPLVITISAQDFVALTNRGELFDTVAQLRNAFVHGR